MTTTSGSGVGQRLGHYRLDSLVGRGAVGEVYRARDVVRNRTVALKVLAPQFAADADYAARFRRECQLVAELTNPHIVPVHDYGEIAGRLYLDMRLVDGPDLGQLIARHGRLSPLLAADLLGQVASALAAAHAKGLIHRDVKPSNVLTVPTEVGDGHFAALSDFGVARSVGGSTATTIAGNGSTMGTLEYMAPERFRSDRIDHRVDIYALGCVLHESLTGRRPYAVRGLRAIMDAHDSAPIPRPSVLVPGVPAELDAVVAKAMAKDPDERYPTAGTFATACREAATGRPGPTVPPPRRPPDDSGPFPPPVVESTAGRPSPWRWILAAVLAVLLLVGAGIVAFAVGRGTTGVGPTTSAGTTSTAPTSTTPSVPSARGWTVQSMFGTGNGTCRAETPLSLTVGSISCTDPTTGFVTFFDQLSTDHVTYVDDRRGNSSNAISFIGEDDCTIDYRTAYTGTDGIAYQGYLRLYKKSPFAWQTTAPATVPWDQVLKAPPPVIANATVLCGG